MAWILIFRKLKIISKFFLRSYLNKSLVKSMRLLNHHWKIVLRWTLKTVSNRWSSNSKLIIFLKKNFCWREIFFLLEFWNSNEWIWKVEWAGYGKPQNQHEWLIDQEYEKKISKTGAIDRNSLDRNSLDRNSLDRNSLDRNSLDQIIWSNHLAERTEVHLQYTIHWSNIII